MVNFEEHNFGGDELLMLPAIPSLEEDILKISSLLDLNDDGTLRTSPGTADNHENRAEDDTITLKEAETRQLQTRIKQLEADLDMARQTIDLKTQVHEAHELRLVQIWESMTNLVAESCAVLQNFGVPPPSNNVLRELVTGGETIDRIEKMKFLTKCQMAARVDAALQSKASVETQTRQSPPPPRPMVTSSPQNGIDSTTGLHGVDPERKPRSSFICNCGATFKTRGQLLKHLFFHAVPKTVKCRICGLLFYFKSSLPGHMKEWHLPSSAEEKRKPYLCEICGTRFVTKKERMKHRQRLHKKKTLPPPPPPPPCPPAPLNGTDSFMHSNNENRVSNQTETFEQPVMRSHLGDFLYDASSGQYICGICGTGHIDWNSLSGHLRIIHNQGSVDAFACLTCEEWCPSISQLWEHLHSKHVQDGAFNSQGSPFMN